jgi:NADPH-dependent curcumin reductase CurA
MVSSKVIRLANPPNRGTIDDSTFRVDTIDLPELQDGQILAKVIALGNEPAQKTWMDTEIDPKRLYMPPIKKDDIVRGPGIVEVVESKSAKFEKGQRLVANPGWREYVILEEKEVQEPAA